MNRLSLFCAACLLAAPLALTAQTAPPPIIPLLETVWSGSLSWRPDWPVSIPPDAFTPSGDSWAVLTLACSGGEYSLARNGQRRLTAFPFFLNGDIFQVSVQADGSMIRGFTLDQGGNDSEAASIWRVDFLEERDSLPYSGRISSEGEDYSVFFDFNGSAGGSSAKETWYAADGTVLKILSYQYIPQGRRMDLQQFRETGPEGELIQDYYYDSSGNISGLRSSRGDFSALYVRESRLRYWEGPLAVPQPAPDETETPDAPPERALLIFQWDERGLLTGLRGDKAEEQGEFRYEYTLDGRGNWIERREFFMIRRFGSLVSVPGEILQRRFEY